MRAGALTGRIPLNLWFNSTLIRLDSAMLRFLLTRFSLIIPTFIGMTLLAFSLIRIVPGDPIETMAGERGIDATRHAALLKEYGLDRPVLVQYGIYIGGSCTATWGSR